MATIERPTAGQVVLYNVPWSTYEALLDGTDSPGTRFTYNQGTLEITSPSREHERLKRLIGRMIETLTELNGIPISSGGSTTMKSEIKQRGLEPDECYYIANEARMRGKVHFDVGVDPPPDLVVEVDITSSSLNRMSIYGALGVPEIWRYDGQKLHVSHLQADGSYARRPRSLAFPSVSLTEFERFRSKRDETDETSWIRSFRAWVKQQGE